VLIRKFIDTLPPHQPTKTSLLDYDTLLGKVGSLPDKIQELTELKTWMLNVTETLDLKSEFDEVCAILKTALLFNDLLIQQQGKQSSEELRREIRTLRNENRQLKTDRKP